MRGRGVGSNNNRWKGGRKLALGYVRLWMPEYHRSDSKGYVFEHIVIVERALGHALRLGADVHHVDENKANNNNANLVACEDRAYHMLLHRRLRALRACGNPNALKCRYCHHYDKPENLSIRPRSDAAGVKAYHKRCAADYQAKRSA